MAPLKALIFDMDDTLYPERAYVESGFRAVAAWLESEFGLSATETLAFFHHAQDSHRGRIFDALLVAQPVLTDRVAVADLVQVYRTHQPDIQLYPGMADLLDRAKAEGLHIGVISDGYLEAQTRKVEALGLASWADPILLTDSWGRDFWKPNSLAFEAIQEALGCFGPDLIYLGDNPKKDFLAPNRMGWSTIRLRLPGQFHAGHDHPALEAAPAQEFHSIDALHQWIGTLRQVPPSSAKTLINRS